MLHAILLIAVLLPVMLGAAILVGRFLRGRPAGDLEISPVAQQHFELYQGGSLNEMELATTRRHYQELLRRGETERIAASLRPGLRYVVKVRALAELGSEDACGLLEAELARRHSSNKLEQNWYWIDLAASLRMIGREESLPALLDCFQRASDFPLMHLFAMEVVCFPGFAACLRDEDTRLSRAALRLLHRALEGLRNGVPPQMVIEARLGEMIESLWDHKPEEHHPLLVRLFLEVQRHLRRAEPDEQWMEEPFERESYDLQRSRMASLDSSFDEYLAGAGPALVNQLDLAKGEQLRDLLLALHDLRHDASDELLRLLKDDHCPCREQVVLGLRWSKDPEVASYLRDWATHQVEPQHRAMKPMRAWSPARPSVPGEFPYRAILQTLRAFPSVETEQFLLVAAHDWDPLYRAQALSSLCWWEPLLRPELLMHLQAARFDHNADVRHAARAALARLGERQALQWFRQALSSENRQCVQDAIHAIAQEGLTLLWPDLDRLADSDEPDLAFLAREALAEMNEELDYRMRRRV